MPSTSLNSVIFLAFCNIIRCTRNFCNVTHHVFMPDNKSFISLSFIFHGLQLSSDLVSSCPFYHFYYTFIHIMYWMCTINGCCYMVGFLFKTILKYSEAGTLLNLSWQTYLVDIITLDKKNIFLNIFHSNLLCLNLWYWLRNIIGFKRKWK